MAEHIRHLTDEDIDRCGIVAAPDILSGTPQENKARFDRLVREAVKAVLDAAVDKVNELVDAGEAQEEAWDAFTVWEPYSARKAYVPGNKVTSGGASYLCIADVPATVIVIGDEELESGYLGPPTSEYWLLIAGKGDKGEKGAKGDKGDTGLQGAVGPVGPTGAQGPMGPAGAAGVQGEPGPVGPAGPQGIQGAPGAQGPIGATGATGPAGPKGDKGDKGDRGDAGERGINGVAVAADGVYCFGVAEDGELYVDYTGSDAPAFSINEAGELELDL